MNRRMTSYDSNTTKDGVQDEIATVRSKPAHIYDNICRRLMQLGNDYYKIVQKMIL